MILPLNEYIIKSLNDAIENIYILQETMWIDLVYPGMYSNFHRERYNKYIRVSIYSALYKLDSTLKMAFKF